MRSGQGGIFTFDGEHFHVAATRGLSDAYATILRDNTYGQVKAGYAVDELSPREQLLNGVDLVHLTGPALAVGPIGQAAADLEKIGTALFVPLRRDAKLLGYITAYRDEEALFSHRQIALLQNFAAQAVIAMENARLLTETREALEQQTATAEVLQVINASPGDLAPVFDAMLERAMHLCDAAFGGLTSYDGEKFDTLATRGLSPELAEVFREPFIPQPGSSHYRLAHGERLIHGDHLDNPSLQSGQPQTRGVVEIGGARTGLVIALQKEDRLIGSFWFFRREVRPFSENQIGLLQNFASQAVIAMENARLLTEQREALEQQTATAEVLQVINASPGNLTPVFDAMLEKAIRLCGGDRGVLWTIEGGRGRLAAARGLPAEFVALLRERGESGTNSPLQRVVQGEWLIEFPDTVEEFSRSGDPHAKGAVEAGVRSAIWVAIVKEGVTVGAFAIGRSVIGTFSDKQIALLQNFAAQAVIAMENARLITETREALERQTATSEVLKAISASPDDAQPVFELIARRAKELSGAAAVGVFEYDGALMHHRMLEGYNAAAVEQLRRQFPRPPGRHSAAGRAVQTGQISHIRDTSADPDFAMPELEIVRSLLGVPLLHEGRVVGAIALARSETGGFGDTQVALVQSFAEQAVIAISSAETYRELQARTAALAQRNSEYGEQIEQQSATIDVLKVMSASPGDAQPVFRLIVERARAFCEGDGATLALLDGDMLHLQAYSGFFNREYEAVFPRPVSRATMFGRAILARDVVQAPDVSVDPDHYTRNTTGGASVRLLRFRCSAPVRRSAPSR
jgi:GAF domain-containing protein